MEQSSAQRYLYLENFRGFKKNFVPLVQVNFFVGENSTGKTSVVQLLRLLGSQQFWFTQNFAEAFATSGHFSDLVSAHAVDKSTFRVGLISEIESATADDDDTKETAALLMSFEENDDGLPRLLQISFLFGSKEVTIRNGPSGLEQSYNEYPELLSLEATRTILFPAWVRIHKKTQTEFKKKDPQATSMRARTTSIPVLFSMIEPQKGFKPDPEALQRSAFSLMYDTGHNVSWIAPIRTKPRRTYDGMTVEYSSEGRHTPYLIRKLLNSRSEADAFSRKMREVGKNSCLFEDIQVKRFGAGNSAPFEVDVKIDGRALSIGNVGYGVAQSLPFIVEMISSRAGSLLMVEQPEVHLHPKAQAAIGSLIFELATTEAKSFIVETHSDFLIDRFRAQLIKAEATTPSQIVYFERKGKCNTATALLIDFKGDLPEDQPQSYRAFYIREQLSNLGF